MSHRFRLATLLKLREQTRDERRRDLAQALQAERILRQRVAHLQGEIEATRQRSRSAGQGNVNIEELLNARRYELLMQGEVTAVNTQLSQVLAEIERRRQVLLEADRDVKVLEKLRQLQATQHAAEEQKRENRHLDEAALRGFTGRQEVTT